MGVCGECNDPENKGMCALEGTLRSGEHIDSGNIGMDVPEEHRDPGNLRIQRH